MTIRLELVDGRDAARIVDALLLAAQHERRCKPMLCRRYIELANRIGDAVDITQLPAHAPSLDPLDPAYGLNARFEGPAVGYAATPTG